MKTQILRPGGRRCRPPARLEANHVRRRAVPDLPSTACARRCRQSRIRNGGMRSRCRGRSDAVASCCKRDEFKRSKGGKDNPGSRLEPRDNRRSGAGAVPDNARCSLRPVEWGAGRWPLALRSRRWPLGRHVGVTHWDLRGESRPWVGWLTWVSASWGLLLVLLLKPGATEREERTPAGTTGP